MMVLFRKMLITIMKGYDDISILYDNLTAAHIHHKSKLDIYILQQKLVMFPELRWDGMLNSQVHDNPVIYLAKNIYSYVYIYVYTNPAFASSTRRQDGNLVDPTFFYTLISLSFFRHLKRLARLHIFTSTVRISLNRNTEKCKSRWRNGSPS